MARRQEPTAGSGVDDLVGPLEAGCLRALWAAGEASVSAVRDKVNAARGEVLAYTTVMTVLSRLYEKSLVERDRVGRAYRYRPVYSEAELVDMLTRREVDELVRQRGEVALAQFARSLRDADPKLRQRLLGLAEDDEGG